MSINCVVFANSSIREVSTAPPSMMRNLHQKTEGRDRDRIQGAVSLQLQKPTFPLVHRRVSGEGEVATCPEDLGNLQPIFAYPVPLVIPSEGNEEECVCGGRTHCCLVSHERGFQLGKRAPGVAAPGSHHALSPNAM